MKKIRVVFIVLMALFLIVPFTVNAKSKTEEKIEEAEEKEFDLTDREKVKVYMFRSNTCTYCEAAIEWFNSDEVQNEYSDYFELVTFEVSEDSHNRKLMEKVKKYFETSGEGVPYIIVGKYDYPNGFSSTATVDDLGTTMGDDLLGKVMETYISEDRFDVFKELNINPYKREINFSLIISSIVVISGIVTFIVFAKRNNCC